MTAVAVYSIACDAPGCDEVWPAGGSGRPSRGDARREARRVGWGRSYTEDRCPAHADKDSAPATVEKIRELAARGLSDGQIAGRIGISRGYAQQLRAANDIPGRPPGRPRSAAYHQRVAVSP